jgi:HlyD family type I secretion membrane fusion protein
MTSHYNIQQSHNAHPADLDLLLPVKTDEFLPPISRWVTKGGLIVVGVILVAATLTSVIQYNVTVKAQATVRPVGGLRIVQAAAEGPIQTIVAKENQPVKQGDLIATIDSSRLQTKKSQLQSGLEQAHLKRVQVTAQLAALNQQIAAETNRSVRAVASATAALRGRLQEHQNRQATTLAEVAEAEANVRAVQAALRAARSKCDRYQNIANSGALSKNQIEEAQLAVSQQEQELEAAQARLLRAQAALNLTDAEVAIATEQIAQERANGQANLAKLIREREALIQQSVEIDEQIQRDTRELQQITRDLRQTTITATADGVIARLNLRNAGQTVRIGEEIAQIVPANASLEVKAAVPPNERNKLQVGQMVQLRVSACPYPDYGTLKGIVSHISEDTIKPQTPDWMATTSNTTNLNNGDTSPFYEVTIKPESRSLSRGDNQCRIQVGVEAQADIVSKQETLLKFLLRKARLTADL